MNTLVEGAGERAGRQEKESAPKEEITGCSERGYAVERCRRKDDLET